MKCRIVVDGESANELFAVGGKDLAEHFLPKALGVKTSDVVLIHFEELRRDGKIISLADAVLGGPYELITSKDQWDREKQLQRKEEKAEK